MVKPIKKQRKESYMGKQKLKGLWIPAEILLNADLSDKEKNSIIYDFIFK